MKMNIPNKLIIFTRNKQVSRIKTCKKTQKQLYEQFHELADIASVRLLLIYTVEKADHNPVYTTKIQFT